MRAAIHEHIEIAPPPPAVRSAQCRRCGSEGAEPHRIGGGFDRPLTLCDGCLRLVSRVCVTADRVDQRCRFCSKPPRVELNVEHDQLRLRTWCPDHGTISLDVWCATSARRPVMAWFDGDDGGVFLWLPEGGWARASFRLREGRELEYGIACDIATAS